MTSKITSFSKALDSIYNDEKWYENIGDELRNNVDFIVKGVLRCSPYTVGIYGETMLTKVASKEILSDLDVAQKIIFQLPLSLKYFYDNVKDDKDTVMVAIKRDGDALKFVSDRLKNDRDVVYKAIYNSSGYAFEFASEELRNDKELANSSLRSSDGETFKYIGESLKSDFKFIKDAASKYNSILRIQDDCTSNRDVILKSAIRDLNSLKYASDDIKKDDKFLLEILREFFSAKDRNSFCDI
jgi:hypothetical protein